MIDRADDSHLAFLKIGVSGAQRRLVAQAKRDVRQADRTLARRSSIGPDLKDCQFMMVSTVAGEKYHLEPSLDLHNLQSEDLAVKSGRPLQIANLDHDVPNSVRLNHGPSACKPAFDCNAALPSGARRVLAREASDRHLQDCCKLVRVANWFARTAKKNDECL